VSASSPAQRDVSGGTVRSTTSDLPARPSDAWRADVVLECWICAEQDPFVVEFDGTLNEATSGQVLAVLDEVLAKRPAELEIRTHGLSVSGQASKDFLGQVPLHIRYSGVVCRWDGVTVSGDFPPGWGGSPAPIARSVGA
jgi:hypothetical protein